MTENGTYTLLVELADSATVAFGALGERDLSVGWYAYTGSAFGPGGFSRVDRHREVATGERDVRHWHVDYLLGHPDSRIRDVVTSAGLNAECEISRRIGEAGRTEDGESVRAVDGVGCSDCDCESHLRYASDGEGLQTAVETAHQSARQTDDGDD